MEFPDRSGAHRGTAEDPGGVGWVGAIHEADVWLDVSRKQIPCEKPCTLNIDNIASNRFHMWLIDAKIIIQII